MRNNAEGLLQAGQAKIREVRIAAKLSPAASNLMGSIRGGAALVVALVHARQVWCWDMLLPTAEYSYTLYVVHFPLQIFAFDLLHQSLHATSWIVSFMAGLAVTVLIIGIASKLATVVENRTLMNRLVQGLNR